MISFTNRDKSISVEDISEVESRLTLTFPDSLKKLFLEANGGEPDPYTFLDDLYEMVIQETLPLLSDNDSETAVDVYQDLVVSRKLVHANLFPFANDPGGDYYFVDCDTHDARVYIYRHDTNFDNLIDLAIGLDGFWRQLE